MAYIGMTWSGFRPSDDACEYGYLIPSSFFAVKSLEQLAEILAALAPNEMLEKRVQKLRNDIKQGLQKYAVVHCEKHGDVYACEVDGIGHYNQMDDANVPSLLSLPYLGCVSADDPVYQNTRRILLSEANSIFSEFVEKAVEYM